MDSDHRRGTINRAFRRACWLLSFCGITSISSTALAGEPATEHRSPQFGSERLLADALKQARADNKRVFIVETGDHCGACVLMSRFVDRHKSILNQDFIVVKIERRPDNAKDPVVSRIRFGKQGGIPWVAILNGDGDILATSNDASGHNLGFPHKRDDIESFIKMISSTSQRMTHNQLQGIENSLTLGTILSEVKEERAGQRRSQ